MEKKDEEYEEHELRITRTKIPVYVEPGVIRNQYVISFWSEKISPMFIYIWEDEYSKEKEKEEIAKKLKEAVSSGVETFKVRMKKT